ncbi:unnamed protein product [Phaedon cochleariae]|uniref:Uncharacterized protein n=1 Tax=Phaedon cochleariae TaxID=80249 RepID=A0A9P0GP21_PHACE|nr:unnamed protein product [Phaedon cochleariae]
MRHIKLLILCASLCFVSAVLPPYIKVCNRNSPDVTKCIINSVEELRPKLKEGIPELHVPSIEPLPLEQIQMRSGPNTAKIDANITNLMVWGPSSFEIIDLKPDIKKNRFIFRINVPQIYFEGDYDINMNILVLKYKGQGPITGNFTNLGADVLLKGRLVKFDGVTHLQFQKFTIHLNVEKSYLYLANLFSGNRNIGRATNQVVNDNSDLFLNEIMPNLESALADKFTEVANIICKTFAYDELFPTN